MRIARDLRSLPARVGGRASYAFGSALDEMARKVRSRHLFVVDVIGMTAASLMALALWLDGSPSTVPTASYFWIVGIVVMTRVAVNIRLGLYGHSWRHASVADMSRIIKCTVVGSLVSAGIVLGAIAFRPPGAGDAPAPIFWLMEMALALGVLAASRFTIRAVSEMSVGAPKAAAGRKRTLIYGAGWAGVTMVRSALRGQGSGVEPVGFLDDDPSLKGRRVSGLPVFGALGALPQAVLSTGATSLLITMPTAAGEVVREIVEVASKDGLEVRTVPPVTDLLDGSLDASRIRRVRIEDLLRRPQASEHAPGLRKLLVGRNVVITGAAGSIGSELARQALAVGPRCITLVDQAESPLYLCRRDLEDRVERSRASGAATEVQITSHLVDVADRAAVAKLFSEVKADVVFHAAAYKHVPVLEDHPSRAIEVNVGGTMSVVDGAVETGVERLVHVSTDKAVRPSSVMGASKRIAEMIVADAARRTGRSYISLRFGNVLGSTGSVVPIFQDQLEEGRPLTITDRDMTRYFMSKSEAAWLILDAAALADGSGLFVLDMGEPISIMDVARDLARLAGRDPDSLPIKVVGLRPGEKLHEELFYDHERVQPTDIPKVLRVESQRPPDTIRDDAIGLLALTSDGSEAELRTALHAYVRGSVEADERSRSSGPNEARPEGAEAVSSGEAARQVVAHPVHGFGAHDPGSDPRREEEQVGQPTSH